VQVGDRTGTLVVISRRQPASGTVPVVLVLHGSMQTAKAIRSFTANTFDQIGASSGAVVAYLDGHKRHWNDARIVNTSAARTDHVDDVAFAKAAIDLLVRQFNGDRAGLRDRLLQWRPNGHVPDPRNAVSPRWSGHPVRNPVRPSRCPDHPGGTRRSPCLPTCSP
jgi:hypothetical protein